MSRTAEEILYPALEDFRIDIVMGEGAARAHADARPAAVHAHRRDDAHRPADDAAARPLRPHVPARLLRRRASSARSCTARRASSASRSPPTRRRRSRGARAARRASRTGSCGACATSRRCGTRARSRTTIAREALTLLEIDEQGLDREARELLRTIAEQVRRRAGRALDARGVARRGAGDDRGRLRAVSAAARLHPAHAARPHDHEARPRAHRRCAGRGAQALLSGIWTPMSEGPHEAFVERIHRAIGAFAEEHGVADARPSRSSSPTARASRSSASSPSPATGW